MITVIVVIHLLVAIALVGTVLLQRSEGGGLGMGSSGGGGMGGFMTGRATANLLTRATGGLAVIFFSTSMALAILSGGDRESTSILDAPAPVVEQPAEPAEPTAPVAE